MPAFGRICRAVIMTLKEEQVGITHLSGAMYPEELPFHPDTAWPEYAFDKGILSSSNDIYRMVRDTLYELDLDKERFDTPDWNPFGDFIKPGHTVVIKPNLVQDRHYRGGDIDCLITHGSVVRAVMDYVYKALDGKGRIVLGDAPVLSTRFEKAVEKAHLNEVIQFYRENASPELEVFDFRLVAGALDDRFHVTHWVDLPGDPAGTVAFNLDKHSLLNPIAHLAHLFRLPHYRTGDTENYHRKDFNKFVVPRSIIDADTVINLPKMKTHCKAGVTGALKNFVGIVALRHCYTNYRRGSPAHDGDEYPNASIIKSISEAIERMIDGNQLPAIRPLLSLAFRINERIRLMLGIDGIRDGAWHGNDTVWRAIIDLVRIARYGQPDGTMAQTPQRTLFTLIDGIIAGEGEGPLESESKKIDCMIAGFNPVAVDACMTTLMGYDINKITTIREALAVEQWPLTSFKAEDIRCLYKKQERSLKELPAEQICPAFAPAYGWRDHIELS